MRMIAEPEDIIASRYRILRDGATLAIIQFSLFGPSTASPIGGRSYRLRRVGALRERFTLEADDGAAPVASVTQRDPLHRNYAVQVGERRLSLRAESLLRSGYLLLEDGRIVGALRPAGLLRHGAAADLPDDLPLEGGVFLLWVALLLWRGRRVTRASAPHARIGVG